MPDSAEKKETKSKKTAPQRLLELSRNADPSVQYAVASNPNAPVQALEYLAGHGKFTILKAVAGNPNVTALILERLARHKQWTVCVAVLSNPSCTPQIFEALSKDAESWVRLHVALKIACPSAVLEMLASDPDAYVRNAVAGNWNTPPATVRRLAADADGYVRAGAVDNSSRLHTSKELTALARDPDVRVRLEIAKLGQHWSPRLHDHLVTDAEEIVRVQIADHGELPVAVVLTLARDSSDEVRRTVARRNRLSKAVLEVLISDPNPEVRRSLAHNKEDDVPVWVLERLAGDADKDVRWQASYNGRTPEATLRQLEETDPDEGVRSSARHCLARSWR